MLLDKEPLFACVPTDKIPVQQQRRPAQPCAVNDQREPDIHKVGTMKAAALCLLSKQGASEHLLKATYYTPPQRQSIPRSVTAATRIETPTQHQGQG